MERFNIFNSIYYIKYRKERHSRIFLTRPKVFAVQFEMFLFSPLLFEQLALQYFFFFQTLFCSIKKVQKKLKGNLERARKRGTYARGKERKTEKDTSFQKKCHSKQLLQNKISGKRCSKKNRKQKEDPIKGRYVYFEGDIKGRNEKDWHCTKRLCIGDSVIVNMQQQSLKEKKKRIVMKVGTVVLSGLCEKPLHIHEHGWLLNPMVAHTLTEPFFFVIGVFCVVQCLQEGPVCLWRGQSCSCSFIDDVKNTV